MKWTTCFQFIHRKSVSKLKCFPKSKSQKRQKREYHPNRRPLSMHLIGVYFSVEVENHCVAQTVELLNHTNRINSMIQKYSAEMVNWSTSDARWPIVTWISLFSVLHTQPGSSVAYHHSLRRHKIVYKGVGPANSKSISNTRRHWLFVGENGVIPTHKKASRDGTARQGNLRALAHPKCRMWVWFGDGFHMNDIDINK